jgi:hypothetical protein
MTAAGAGSSFDVSYTTKVYGMGDVAGAFLLAALGFGFFVSWWLAARLASSP